MFSRHLNGGVWVVQVLELVNTGFRSTLLVGAKKLFLKHGIIKSNILKV